jgi:hypothetical protein
MVTCRIAYRSTCAGAYSEYSYFSSPDPATVDATRCGFHIHTRHAVLCIRCSKMVPETAPVLIQYRGPVAASNVESKMSAIQSHCRGLKMY